MRPRLLGFVGVFLLLGCVATPPIAFERGPGVEPEGPGVGQATVAIRWPEREARHAQAIPLSASVARLTVFDGGGRLLATATLQRREGELSSTASLELPVGDGREVVAALDAPQATGIAEGRSQAFQVRRNQVVDVAISLQPVIRTLYGGGTLRGDGGPAASAQFNQPTQLSVGLDGTLYVADGRNHAIRAIAPDGTIQTLVGRVDAAGTASRSTLAPDNTGEGGPAGDATAGSPFRVLAASNGDVFYADTPSLSPLVVRVHLIPAREGRRFGKDVLPGRVYTVATFSTANAGAGLALEPDGALLLCEPEARRIHRLGPMDSTTSVLIGESPQGIGEAMPPNNVSLLDPQDVLLDPRGNVLFSEGTGSRLRMLCRVSDRYFGVSMQAGLVYTVMAGDRPGMPWPQESLPSPRQLALDRVGHLYFVDNINHAVYRVAQGNGAVTRVAGGAKTPLGATDLGDGGPAANATLNLPRGLAIDAFGRLLVGDTFNHRIRSLYL